ncbi:hypothetical protein MAPG_11832 [Magnaporthiopsis poae ATCC 64411]|uniref:Uncharacterized protein n=1 Tax=Magnaporthiopsis poae (strain ATCC 64411 / 73-15) TaxID=644358 RepID=A0A0C4EGA4_MAGP6|nr:hypothetical protein MAPG_11832 [Magnaporthiopsis poae ATCC 64411]
MLANQILLVLGFVITGAVSLPVAQGTTDSAPTILDRDLSGDIHPAALQARAPGDKKQHLRPGKPGAPSNQWANPFLPKVVEKKGDKKDDIASRMDQHWTGASKPAPRPGTTKPPKVPVSNRQKGKGKRDVDEEAEEGAEYDQ